MKKKTIKRLTKKKATKKLLPKERPTKRYLVTVGGADWYCGTDEAQAKNIYRDLINLIQDHDLFIDVEVSIP